MFLDKNVAREMSIRNELGVSCFEESEADLSKEAIGVVRVGNDDGEIVEYSIMPMDNEVYNDPMCEALDKIATLLIEDAKYKERAGMALKTKRKSASQIEKHIKELLAARTIKQLDKAVAKFSDEHVEQVKPYAEIMRTKLAG